MGRFWRYGLAIASVVSVVGAMRLASIESDSVDEANGPVSDPISVTMMVLGVAGAVGAVVVAGAAVVFDAAAVVVDELLLLELQAATTHRPAAISATPTRVRVRYLPSGIVDIFLLVMDG